MKISRMKTYRFNGKDISGYRALVRERRAAKLASGGYTMRKDGSVIHRHFRPRVGRLGFSGRPLKPAPIAAMADVQGQCRDGTIITTSMVDWGCRHAGGTGWSHKPARITGLRED